MGGTASKKLERSHMTPTQSGKLSFHSEQKRRTPSGFHFQVGKFIELNRSSSEMIGLSAARRTSDLLKSSCGNVNTVVKERWGILKRNNNSNPTFSIQVTSMSEKINGSKTSANNLDIFGNIRPTNLKSVSPHGRKKLRSPSREQLRRRDTASPVQDEIPSHNRQLPDGWRNSSDGDTFNVTNDTRINSTEERDKINVNVGSNPNLLSSTGSLLSLKSPKQNQNLCTLSSGDVAVTGFAHPVIAKRKRVSDPHFLTEKPPTPPMKPKPSREFTASRRALVPNPRRNSEPIRKLSMSKPSESPSSPTRISSPRANSLPIEQPIEKWIRLPRTNSRSLSPISRRRQSISSTNADMNSTTDRQACLSRIEYTFYITDTEENQRPFYDRRIEAVARASQCNICLHKPSPGYRSVYYKGNRVLPVTISSRTMIALKRCIARLDIQYPYFNVKAFCPPDMY